MEDTKQGEQRAKARPYEKTPMFEWSKREIKLEWWFVGELRSP
jgi:hypothetical protein